MQSSRARHGRPGRGSVLVLAAAASIVFLASSPAHAQWVRGSYLSPAGSCPPFVFVTLTTANNQRQLGADAQDDLDLGAAGRQLWFMDRRMTDPILVFPLATHATQGLISSPISKGSVHEPSVYHHLETNQYWVIFAYANDLQTPNVARPCEIYAMNITPAVEHPTTFNNAAAANLTVVKLTNSPTTVAGITAKAFNPTLFPQQFWAYGVSSHFAINSGPCVVDEEHGPTLYFASNERRADGLGLMAGDLLFAANSVQLLNKREIQHFGTTSLASFFETPGGAGGSYRSSTESTGQWSSFEFRSDEGFWQTMTGYANQINIADHNGTTVAIGDDPKDARIVVGRYYINNNEGFGAIMTVPYDKVGLNDDSLGFDVQQHQILNLVDAVDPFGDLPSAVGKFGMPAGGRKGASLTNTELFLAYSPTCSNDKSPCSGIYHATLVAVTDISVSRQPRSDVGTNPSTYANPAYGDAQGVFGVLKHPTLNTYWMKPILTHEQRFGWTHRKVSPLFPKPKFLPASAQHLDGMPVAKFMAGPIYNTDVQPQRRRTGSYDPTTEVRNGAGEQLIAKLACLTKDLDPATLDIDDVWGIRIFATDPKVRSYYGPTGSNRRIDFGSPWNYLHHNGSGVQGTDGDAIEFERYRHLSDVPVEADGSIGFLLPANIPIKLHLLHKDGTTLAAHRNHHSFSTGQVDGRCGGCHQHRPGLGADPSGLIAFQPGHVPFDTLTNTGKLGWDAAGNTVFTVHANTPSLPVPEFKADIWPKLRSNCGSCHASAINAGGTGLARFDMDGPIANLVPGATNPVARETAVWSWLHNQRYINRRIQAAKSPLSWYFTGVADDTVLRLDGEPNSRYRNAPGSRYWITTSWTQPDGTVINPHSGVANQSDAYAVIEWIDAGAAIDHTVANGGGVKHDGFQIGVSAKLDQPGAGAATLKVGYYDLAANCDRVLVSWPGGSSTHVVPGPVGGFRPNGTFTLPLPAGLADTGNVSIEAIDENDNHSRLEKSMKQLRIEADLRRGEVTMSSNGPVFTSGQTMTFSIRSAPSLAGSPFMFLMSEGIYPGTPMGGLGLGIYDVQNTDAWMNLSLAIGIVGTLDASGSATHSIPLPPGTAPVTNLYCEAAILTASGIAESNLVGVKIK